MKFFLILIYFIMMVILGYTSKNKRKRKLEVTEKKLPDVCIKCSGRFPVLLQFSCGHELCALCIGKVINVFGKNNCPRCQTPLPRLFKEYQTMIYPIQLKDHINKSLTQDIALQKLQYAFPLICSVADLATVTKCITMGVNVDTKGPFGYFPLHLVSQRNVANCLIQNGADVNRAGSNGVTPLLMSYQNDDLPIFGYLVENGANVNQARNDGGSPLLMSSQDGRLSVVKYLVEHGADINQSTNRGSTPLFMCSQNGHLQVVEYLVKNHADVNQTNANGATPLYVSSQNNHLSIVEYLVKNGADVNKRRNDGANPLLISAQNGCLEVVKFLVENHADVNQLRNDGGSPLLMSSINGHLSIVKYLVEKGANLNQAANGGITPLSAAISNNESEVAKFLLTKHAHIETAKLFLKKIGPSELINNLDELCKELKK